MRGLEELAAEGEVGFTIAVGVESVVTDALEARWNGVQQKAADKLIRIQGHRSLLLWIGRAVVFVAEAHLAIVVADETVVGDRYSVGVPSEIVDRLVWPAERGFGVDDPVLLACPGEVLLELGFVAEMAELSVEAQFGLVELIEEEAAEEFGQNMNAEEEVPAAGDPTLAVWAGAAAGNDAVDVRMMQQVLTPGVQDREEADVGTQVFGVGCDGEECFGTCGKEDVVDLFFVLQR